MHNKIFTYSLFIIILILLGKISGLLKDVLLTYYFGADASTDAFFVSLFLSSLVYTALFASISLVIIPSVTKVRKGELSVSNLYAIYLSYIIISVFLCLFVLLCSKQIVIALSGSSNVKTIELASDYLGIMAITFPLSTIVAILNSGHATKSRPTFYYITPIINNIFFCSFLFLFKEAYGLYPAVIAGIFSWLLILIINFHHEKVNLNKMSRRIIKVKVSDFNFTLISTAFLFVLFEQVISYSPIYFASLGKPGDVTLYVLANKLLFLIVSVALAFITAQIFPKMAKKQKHNEIRDNLIFYFDIVLILCLPVIFIVYQYTDVLVSIVFERGEFNQDNVQIVSAIFLIVMFGLPATIFKDFLNRVYFSLRFTRECLVITVLFTVSYIVFGLTLYYLYQLDGLAYAFTINSFLHVFVLLITLSKKIQIVFLTEFLSLFFSRTLICISLAFVLSFFNASIFLYSLIYFMVYLLILKLMRHPIVSFIHSKR